MSETFQPALRAVAVPLTLGALAATVHPFLDPASLVCRPGCYEQYIPIAGLTLQGLCHFCESGLEETGGGLRPPEAR